MNSGTSRAFHNSVPLDVLGPIATLDLLKPHPNRFENVCARPFQFTTPGLSFHGGASCLSRSVGRLSSLMAQCFGGAVGFAISSIHYTRNESSIRSSDLGKREDKKARASRIETIALRSALCAQTISVKLNSSQSRDKIAKPQEKKSATNKALIPGRALKTPIALQPRYIRTRPAPYPRSQCCLNMHRSARCKKNAHFCQTYARTFAPHNIEIEGTRGRARQCAV